MDTFKHLQTFRKESEDQFKIISEESKQLFLVF